MALQVWLPLTGNLKNLGLDDITITNQSISGFVDSGKIGKALTLLNSYYYMNIPSLVNATVFSCAFWYKKNINSTYTVNWKRIVAFETQREGESNGLFRFESSYASANYDVSVHSNAAYQICPSSTGNKSLVADGSDWHHVAMAVDGQTINFYVDGDLVNSGSQTTGSLTGLVSICQTNNQADGWLNDLRIYNHALSQKEVKELSKGLVAHYPLNDGIGGENLMPNSNIMGLGSANPSTGTWRLAGTSTMTKSRLLIEDSPIGKCYCFQNSGVQTANDGSCYGIDSFPLEANTQYTISMFARIVDGREGYAGYNVYHISSEDGGTHTKIDKNYRVTPLNEDGSWTRCIYTFTTNASTTRNIYIGITTGTENVTTQMCLIKIEKGSIVTPWTPNLNDELYSTLGLDNGIVYDCSGYGHDGNIVGSISINSEAPRYTVSSSFSGNEQILAESPTAEAKSASLWIYIPSIETNNLVFADYKSKLAFGFYSSYIVTAVTGDNNYRTTYESSLLTNNSWHHIVIVKSESSGMELWIDGVKQTPRSGYDAWSSGMSDGLTIGARTNGNNKFIGSISDLRIYAIALSAEDIKSLYETAASIDDHGNVYGYELEEV